MVHYRFTSLSSTACNIQSINSRFSAMPLLTRDIYVPSDFSLIKSGGLLSNDLYVSK